MFWYVVGTTQVLQNECQELMSLYLLINVFSVAIPLLFSFHKRLNFVAEWKYVLPAIFIALVPFIFWDVLFTRSGIWGFNGVYLLGIDLIHLPLEEWLFFICIPYACLFTHHSLQKIKSGFKLSERSTDFITVLSLTVFLLLMFFFHDKAYTFVNAAFAFVILMIARLIDRSVLSELFSDFFDNPHSFFHRQRHSHRIRYSRTDRMV